MTATDSTVSFTRHPLRIGLVGTFPPRPCGLATFTADVATSLRDAGDDVVIASLVDAVGPRVPGVVFQLVQSSEHSARDIAARLSRDVDVVLIQHEFGMQHRPLCSAGPRTVFARNWACPSTRG
jgi:hypothetical protein